MASMSTSDIEIVDFSVVDGISKRLCEHFKEVFFPKQKPLDLEEQTKTNELKALEEEIEREIKIIIDRQKHVDQLNHKRELLKRSLKGLEKQKDDLFQNVFKGFAKMLTEDDKKMEIEADSEPVLDEPLSFFETSDTLNTSISSNTSTAPEPSLKRKAHLIANDSFGKKKKVLEDQSRSMQMLGASLRANAGKVTNGSPTTPGKSPVPSKSASSDYSKPSTPAVLMAKSTPKSISIAPKPVAKPLPVTLSVSASPKAATPTPTLIENKTLAVVTNDVPNLPQTKPATTNQKSTTQLKNSLPNLTEDITSEKLTTTFRSNGVIEPTKSVVASTNANITPTVADAANHIASTPVSSPITRNSTAAAIKDSAAVPATKPLVAVLPTKGPATLTSVKISTAVPPATKAIVPATANKTPAPVATTKPPVTLTGNKTPAIIANNKNPVTPTATKVSTPTEATPIPVTSALTSTAVVVFENPIIPTATKTPVPVAATKAPVASPAAKTSATLTTAKTPTAFSSTKASVNSAPTKTPTTAVATKTSVTSSSAKTPATAALTTAAETKTPTSVSTVLPAITSINNSEMVSPTKPPTLAKNTSDTSVDSVYIPVPAKTPPRVLSPAVSTADSTKNDVSETRSLQVEIKKEINEPAQKENLQVIDLVDLDEEDGNQQSAESQPEFTLHRFLVQMPKSAPKSKKVTHGIFRQYRFDEKYLYVSLTSGLVKRVNIADSRDNCTYNGGRKPALAVIYLASLDRVYTATTEGIVRWFEAGTGKLISSFQCPCKIMCMENSATSCKSPPAGIDPNVDSSLFIIGLENGGILQFDAKHDKLVNTFNLSKHAITNVLVIDDHRFLYCEQNNVLVHDIIKKQNVDLSAEHKAYFPIITRKYGDRVYALHRINYEQQTMLLRVFDAQSLKCVDTIQFESYFSSFFLHDNLMYFVGMKNLIQCFSVKDWSLVFSAHYVDGTIQSSLLLNSSILLIGDNEGYLNAIHMKQTDFAVCETCKMPFLRYSDLGYHLQCNGGKCVN